MILTAHGKPIPIIYREGDNTILVQQCAKFILTNFQKKLKGKPVEFQVTYKINQISDIKILRKIWRRSSKTNLKFSFGSS